jgi:hypothetical protein
MQQQHNAENLVQLGKSGDWTLVTLTLTEEQCRALKELTGQDLDRLQLSVEDVEDLASVLGDVAKVRPIGSSRKLTHREYIIDRSQRIASLFEELRGSEELHRRFLADPAGEANRFGVALTDEEVFGVKVSAGVDLENLMERLILNPVAFFDANCSCAILGTSKLNVLG